MRTIRTLALLLLAAALPAGAQTLTQVSGTIADANGVPYSGAKIQILLTPSVSARLTPCNNPQTGCPIQNPSATTADVNGTFSIALYANGSILPASTQWQFNVTETGIAPPLGYGPQSFSVDITISGASQDVSSTLSTAAPILVRSGIAAGVSSFNGRTGAVVPAANDYSFSMLSGVATNAQLQHDLTTLDFTPCTLGGTCTPYSPSGCPPGTDVNPMTGNGSAQGMWACTLAANAIGETTVRQALTVNAAVVHSVGTGSVIYTVSLNGVTVASCTTTAGSVQIFASIAYAADTSGDWAFSCDAGGSSYTTSAAAGQVTGINWLAAQLLQVSFTAANSEIVHPITFVPAITP